MKQKETALVTGATGGLGREFVKQLVARDYHVIATGRDKNSLAELDREYEAVTTVQCDLSNSVELEQLVLFVEQLDCKLTLLINNAGTQYQGDVIEDQGFLEKSLRDVHLSLTVPLQLSVHLLPLLLQQSSAAIINVGSALAEVPKQVAPAYCAAKAGLHSLSRSLGWQLENTSVRVVELVPAVVDTGMSANRDSKKQTPEQVISELFKGLAKNKKRIAVGKAGILIRMNRFLPALAEKIIRHS